jgi:Integrase core domain
VRAVYGQKIVNFTNCSLSLAINTEDATANALPLSCSRASDRTASGARLAT